MLNENLKTRIEAFVAHCDKVKLDNDKRNNYVLPPTVHGVTYSAKWAKISEMRNYEGKLRAASTYALICLEDGNTKGLGNVKAGDIHKPASVNAPAKHARGSVFQEDFGNCAGPYGIVYLR